MPAAVAAVIQRIGENCEPALCSVVFMAGAGGSLRAGVTENPILLTRSVASGATRVTMGGAPVTVWPGGGITIMVDVTRMPKQAFGFVPTPAIVAPIEFTLARSLYQRLGGHVADIVSIDDVIATLSPQRAHRWLAATTTPGRLRPASPNPHEPIEEPSEPWPPSAPEEARARRQVRPGRFSLRLGAAGRVLAALRAPAGQRNVQGRHGSLRCHATAVCGACQAR